MKKTKRSKNLKQFLSYCKSDIRKEELICSLLPLGLFSYTLFLQEPWIYSRLFLIHCVLVFALGIMVVRRRLKADSGEKLSDYPTDKLYDIIKEMDCEPRKNPFVVISNKNTLAFTTIDKKINFGKEYLEKLENDEISFVIGHESFHYCGRGRFYFFISLPFMILIPIFLGLATYGIVLWTFPTVLNNFNPVLLLFTNIVIAAFLCLPMILLLVALMLRGIESMADLQGVEYSNKKAAIMALDKGYGPKKPNFFGSHPKLETRKKNIDNMP